MKLPPLVYALLGAGAIWYVADREGWISDRVTYNADQAAIATESLQKYGNALADDFEREGRALANGKSLDAIHKELSELNRAARKQSFAPVDEILQATMDDQKLTDQQRADVLYSISKGLREAVKGK